MVRGRKKKTDAYGRDRDEYNQYMKLLMQRSDIKAHHKQLLKEYYRKNKSKLLKKRKQWRKQNREKYNEYQKNYQREYRRKKRLEKEKWQKKVKKIKKKT